VKTERFRTLFAQIGIAHPVDAAGDIAFAELWRDGVRPAHGPTFFDGTNRLVHGGTERRRNPALIPGPGHQALVYPVILRELRDVPFEPDQFVPEGGS